jgi:uncharacterized membrane protein
LASIDAARGAAMIFVCLSHFANNYHFATGARQEGIYLFTIGLVASPTFVIVSGIVAGFMSVARKVSFARFRRKLLDRGVFLLLVGHAVLASTGALAGKGFSYAYRIGYITDAIAIAILIGPWLVAALHPKSRLLLAAGIFGLDWCAIMFWHQNAGIYTLAKHYLIGVVDPVAAGVTFPAFPVIPWFAVYLVGTVIGERVGASYARGDRREGERLLARIGMASFVFGSGAKLGLILIKRFAPHVAQGHPSLMPLLSSYQKYPPGPTYLLFYTGAGLMIVAGVLGAERQGMLSLLLNLLREIGQASLFSYVVEFHLYAVLLPMLRLHYSPFWPLLFGLSVLLLAAAAAAWNSIEGNRFLTVGIAPLLERNALRRRNGRDNEVTVDVAAA